MTTLTLSEILAKIQNGSATADEVASLGKLYTEEQDKKKKWQEVFNKLIDTIEKAKIDPVMLPRCQNGCRSDRFGKLGGVDWSMNWHDTDKNLKTGR